MSILDRGPHTVTVQRVKAVEDKYGGNTYLPDGDPVPVRGLSVQVVDSDEIKTLGVQVLDTYRVIGRGPWPGGPHSTVTWNGGSWKQVGNPRLYTTGRRTGHFDVLIQDPTTGVK